MIPPSGPLIIQSIRDMGGKKDQKKKKGLDQKSFIKSGVYFAGKPENYHSAVC